MMSIFKETCPSHKFVRGISGTPMTRGHQGYSYVWAGLGAGGCSRSQRSSATYVGNLAYDHVFYDQDFNLLFVAEKGWHMPVEDLQKVVDLLNSNMRDCRHPSTDDVEVVHLRLERAMNSMKEVLI